MAIACIWEHNGADTLLWARDYPGAYARGAALGEALDKLPGEVRVWARWCGWAAPEDAAVEIVEERACGIPIREADTQALFKSERGALTPRRYEALKALAMRSARDAQMLCDSVPDKDATTLSPRQTFYGPLPRTAREMLEHMRGVNGYYFGQIGVATDEAGTLETLRARAFRQLEQESGDYLQNRVFVSGDGEEWTLAKVCRRFVWHDRIHAKAMFRMASKLPGAQGLDNRFFF